MDLIEKKRKREEEEEEEGRDNKVMKMEKIDDYKFCIGYSSPIYAFQLKEERAMMMKKRWDYMREIQTEIDPSDRSEMIHTILLLAHHLKLEFESICLAASFLDRFLASHKVDRDNCPAIAFTCLMLASKFLDSQLFLSSKDFVLIRGVSEEQVLYMEKIICEHLNFDFWKPTTYTFLRKYLGIALEGKEFGDIQLDSLAFCFGEMSLLHYGSLAHAPSEIAAALIFLAFFTLEPDEHPWPLTLQKEIEMIPEDFLHCILSIHNWIISGKSEFRSIRAKYLEQQFKGVGTLEPIDHIPDDYFKRVDR